MKSVRQLLRCGAAWPGSSRRSCLRTEVVAAWFVGLTQMINAADADAGSASWRVAVDPVAIVDQQVDATRGRNACGPTALLNALRFATGAEKSIYPSLLGPDDATRLRFLVDRWFAARASEVDPKSRRYGAHGCFAEDLAAGFNELLEEHRLEPVRGAYMDRLTTEDQAESDRDFVERIHGELADSLRAGLPPVVSLRSFIARKHYGESDDSRWGLARHHFVVVTSVPKRLSENELGFRFEYVDPFGGQTGAAYVFAEQHLPFRAFRGSNGIGQWLRGTPFLLVVAPGIESLQPLKADWPDRVIITLNYAICR